MREPDKEQVVQLEARLRQAMLASDVRELNELLSDDLMFTNHLGQLISKADDVDGHARGLVNINAVSPSDQRIQLHGKVAIVSVLVHLAGSYHGSPGQGDFRFTRVWRQTDAGRWQVVAGHACVVAHV